jgi:hypothetical protein
VELRAVVDGHGLDAPGGAADECDGASVRGLNRACLELADHEIPGLAIDEREDAVLVGASKHRVALEVTDAGSIRGTRRSCGDGPFAG